MGFLHTVFTIIILLILGFFITSNIYAFSHYEDLSIGYSCVNGSVEGHISPSAMCSTECIDFQGKFSWKPVCINNSAKCECKKSVYTLKIKPIVNKIQNK